MVRVISVHHFSSQNIQTVEQPTACTIAAPDRLLLALTNNCIEVRDLKNDSDLMFTFPTVDEVIDILHCINGDYVVTLETKFNHQNKEINFVRVYINWNSVATLQQSKMTNSGVSLGSSECGMVQPMRARIAGRVTPTTNQSELGNLEMIEIPVKRNPHHIACCQTSGNLLIQSGSYLDIYTFQVKTHDISKIRFIDFEDAGIQIELSFTPNIISISENFIACMNSDSMHLFKIIKRTTRENSADLLKCNEDNFTFRFADNEPMDYQKLLKEELQDSNREKMTINLPSILKDNSLIHKHSPFTFYDKDMVARVHIVSSVENRFNSYSIENLIQLKLVPIIVQSSDKQVTEEFKTFVLKPLYIEESLNRSTVSKNVEKFLTSDFNKSLNSICCMLVTQQEGYMYLFSNTDAVKESDNCIAMYSFTAPIHQLVMEDTFLHALTETGLESYTLRFGHKLCRNIEFVDNVNVACPSIYDSICLVGLRPFLGVEKMLLSENHLVLLASADSSPTHSIGSNSSSTASYWTLYSLELPTPKSIFNDISIVANVHRFTSVQTYCHLMSEIHMILRVILLLKKWRMADEIVKLVIENRPNKDDIVDLYRTSCALLGDHFIVCPLEDEYSLAIPYYRMGRIKPYDVMKRVKKVQEQSNNHSTKGLIYYLKSILLDVKNSAEADKMFSNGSKQNFVDSIITLLKNQSYEDLPNIILKSKIFREYSTDKLIDILTREMSCKSIRQAETLLALALLHVQKCNNLEAEVQLKAITLENLQSLLIENLELLFDTTYNSHFKAKGTTTFSELAILLISIHPDMMAELFVELILDKKAVNLGKFIKIFLEYLPSSIGSDINTSSLVLQKTLELYFRQYFAKVENNDFSKINYERGANEAIKILVRSYLSQLQILQIKDENAKKDHQQYSRSASYDERESSDKEVINGNNTYFTDNKESDKEAYLFQNFRYSYLDKMPPFQIEIVSKLYKASVENYVAKEDDVPNQEADSILAKLQALLCSPIVSKQIAEEVNAFLSLNENLRGKDGIRSIKMSANDAIVLLLDVCPQCLLQFGKDRFMKADEWKFLIASVQRKILKLSQTENLKRVCLYYKKLLKDILSHVATSMTLDQLFQVFPQRFSAETMEYLNNQTNQNNTDHGYNSDEISDNIETAKIDVKFSDNDLDILNEVQNYEPYVIMCKETMNANQIHKLITKTGQQLLTTLNS